MEKKSLLVSSLICGAVLAAGAVGVHADKVSTTTPAVTHTLPANSGYNNPTWGGSGSYDPSGSYNPGISNPTWNGSGNYNPGATTPSGIPSTMPNGQPYDPYTDGAPNSTVNNPNAHRDQNQPLTGPTASNGQPNTWNGDPNEPCTLPKQIGRNAYEVGVMDPAAFNAMSWLKYFLAQKDPQAKILKVGISKTPYGFIKVFTIRMGNGQTMNFKLKIDAVRNAPHFEPSQPNDVANAQVDPSVIASDEQHYENAKHPHVNPNQMHPVATLDVTVSGKFDVAEANTIIQTTANNRAIHIDMANAFPVDPQQHLYYFYVQVPGGKEYLLAFRVSINNQLTARQFSCSLESGQIPWPTQGIQPSYNNPYGNQGNPSDNPYGPDDPYGNQGNPSDNPYGPDDPYGNQGNPSNNPYGPDNPYGNQGNPYDPNNPYGGSTNDPYGNTNNPYGSSSNDPYGNTNTGNTNNPYGSSSDNPYGGTTSNPTGSQNNPYGNTTGNSGNTSSTGSVNNPYDGTNAWN